MYFKKFFSIFTVILLLASCTSIPFIDDKKVAIEPEELTAEELYEDAFAKLKNGYYSRSIEQFEEIERLYPFSKLSVKAQVMIAYANYRDEEFDSAIDIINSFSKLNPGNRDIAYMYYLKALCYYEQIADIKHDQEISRLAFEALQELIRRYPESKYAQDARLKIDLVRNHLAGKEMEIGRFYMKSEKFVAAANRFQKVIKNYQDTSHIEEALYRMVETYLSLGILGEAQRNASVLGHNYPDSKWYKYAYRLIEDGKNSPLPLKKKSWIREKLTFSSPSGTLPNDNMAESWLDKIKDVF